MTSGATDSRVTRDSCDICQNVTMPELDKLLNITNKFLQSHKFTVTKQLQCDHGLDSMIFFDLYTETAHGTHPLRL